VNGAARKSPDYFVNLLHGLAPVQGEKGRRLASESKWREAQVAFARAWCYGPPEEKGHWLGFLSHAIREEIVSPLIANKRDNNQPNGDPRSQLPPELHGMVWATRAKVLEEMDRLSEAVHAYSEAYKLSPKADRYKAEMFRIGQEIVYRHAGRPQVYSVGPARPPATLQFHEVSLAPGRRPMRETGGST
jgi:hypothetical protein